MIIYKAENLINGKVYIGKTVKSLKHRISRHVANNRGEPFARAIKKYGIQSIEFSVIDVANDEATLSEKEKYWIKYYNSHSGRGYNLTDGGEGSIGLHHTEESKAKVSAANKGRKRSLESIRRTADANRGRRHTLEELGKMSVSRKLRPSPMLGKKHSEATKEKMRAWNRPTGWKASDETKARMSASHACDKSYSAKLSWPQVKEIRKISETGIIDLQELGKAYNVNYRTIWKVVNNKSWREQAQGVVNAI